MILNKVVGNIEELKNLGDFHVEKIYLESDELLKRIIRVTSDHNNEYGISLDKGQKLSDGDILFKDGKNIIVVTTKEDDVLVVSPKSINEMGIIAHALGNRHLPVQVEEGKIILQYDYVVEKMLQDDNIDFQRTNMKLKQAFKHVDYRH